MVAAATAPSPRRRGLNVGWLLLGAAVMGTTVGVGLALRKAPNYDQALDESQAAAERSLPQGAPLELALPNQSTDPYAADAKSLAGVPPYPGAAPRKLAAGSALAQKAPMAIAWFETADSVDDVITWYEKAYTASRTIFASHRYESKNNNPRLGYVGYIDPPKDPELDVTDGLLHLVTAMQQGQRTVVLVSALQPIKLLETLQGLPDGVVFPPRSKPVQLFDLSEGPQSHQTMTARVKQTSVDEALDYYTRHFERSGWAVTERNTTRLTRQSLSAAKANTTQVVVIESKGADVQVMVSYDSRGQAAPREPIR